LGGLPAKTHRTWSRRPLFENPCCQSLEERSSQRAWKGDHHWDRSPRKAYTGIMPNEIRSYPPTWEGDLVLACRKCQRKLKGVSGMRALAKLKKTVKRRNREHPEAVLHVINVSCMDLCPKNGVTVCIPASPARLLVLRDDEGIDQLYHRA
jgi:hypothetical protein